MMRVVVRVATSDAETLRVIDAALDARVPMALLHPALPADEIARQRALIEAADYRDDDAVILFTSGSTGSARGAVLSRAAIDAAVSASWEHLGTLAGDRWLCTLSLAHAGGLSIVLRCRARGIPCIVADVEDRARARVTSTSTSTSTSTIRLLADGGITLLSLVPTQLADLLADPAWQPPPTLRAVLLGGAAAPRRVIDAAIARGVPVLPTYGMTETLGQIATARVPGGPLMSLPGVDITGGTREAPALLRVRAPMLAARYLDGTPIAPELTTSDLGFIEDGALHIAGRADDVIITGGENVHPAQVEAVLAATPGVRAAMVFGLADARWGQIVGAAITVEPTFDRELALAYWHASLPPFARPRQLALVPVLPRLPSGKLDRRQVAALPTSPIEYP